ncbi:MULTISPECIES: Zn-ribbon domain-containing OB-fold protein [Amycolatopsis]|uniref:OB-fold domain-containing protein n=1 Tax=Amycolatopsis dongchuanensis TaxID=1070866 RepID=A0ABP9QG93_9PSEU
MAILPVPGELTAPYWEHARRHELALQHCRSCDRLWHPPLPRCPHCHSATLDWHRVSGRGTVYSATVVEHPTHAALADRVPYVVALVELAEGPRVVANIRGCEPDEVHIGQPVRVTFEDVTDEITLPQFTVER